MAAAFVGVARTQEQYKGLSDNQLLGLIGEQRDRTALFEIYIRYKGIIGRFLQGENTSSPIADEVYNDLMLAVWNQASSFRGDSKVSTWLFAIAYRIRLTHSQKEFKHKHSRFDEMKERTESEYFDRVCDDRTNFESIYLAIKQLSQPHRMVVELSYFFGHSTKEIAQIVSCPQNTVKTRLFHARKHLKQALLASDDAASDTPSGGVNVCGINPA